MEELFALFPKVSDILEIPLIMLITALSLVAIMVPLRLLWKLIKGIISYLNSELPPP